MGLVLFLSVAHCPHRMRCDRQLPCISCSKRGDAVSCNYSNGGRAGRDKYDGESRASEAQLRLQKLEEMVTSLMQTNEQDSEHHSEKKSPQHVRIDQRLRELSVHNPPKISETSLRGHLDVHGSETNYLDATHWVTILKNVSVFSGRRSFRYTAQVL